MTVTILTGDSRCAILTREINNMREPAKVEGTEVERLKAISINAARELGQASNARRIAILALNGTDYSVTTWGATSKECRALAKWAESRKAIETLRTIADARPDGGIISVANEPGVISDFGVGGNAVLHQIEAERLRQIDGWTPEQSNGELAAAAACSVIEASCRGDAVAIRSNLIKAAALLVAEIERLDRVAKAAEVLQQGLERYDANEA